MSHAEPVKRPTAAVVLGASRGRNVPAAAVETQPGPATTAQAAVAAPPSTEASFSGKQAGLPSTGVVSGAVAQAGSAVASTSGISKTTIDLLSKMAPGRHLVRVDGDGDCLFRAVAASIPGVNWQWLRAVAIARARLTPTQAITRDGLSPLTMYAGVMTWENYLQDFMYNTEPYIEFLMLLGHITSRPITVLTPTAKDPFSTYDATSAEEAAKWKLFEPNVEHVLLFFHNNHYDAVVNPEAEPLAHSLVEQAVPLLSLALTKNPAEGPIGGYRLMFPGAIAAVLTVSVIVIALFDECFDF